MRTTLVIARCSTECGFHFDWELGQRVIEPKDAGLFRRRQYWISDQVFPGNFRLDPAQIVEGFNRAPQRPTEVNRRLVEAVIGDTIDAKAIEGGTRHPHRSNPHWQYIPTMASLMIFAHPWPSP